MRYGIIVALIVIFLLAYLVTTYVNVPLSINLPEKDMPWWFIVTLILFIVMLIYWRL